MQILRAFSSEPSGLGPRCREIAARDRERLFFLMHQMMKCGQTTEGALRAVSKAFRTENKEGISAALNAIALKTSQGKPLSQAMTMEYIMFDDIHRAAIMAGETSNNMVEAFHILQVLEDKKIAAQRTGMAEIVTPTILLVMSLFSLFNTGLNTMPVMAQVAQAQGKEVPAIPQAMMAFTRTCADFWYLILAVVLIAVIVGYSIVKTTQGRYWLDMYTLRVPGLGKYIAYKTYAQMLLYFPHMIASGVKPKQMIPIMEAMATNIILKRRIDAFNQVITTGGQMSSAMEKAGFPSIAVTPVTVSEHYAGSDEGINDVMIEGMNHAYTIIERDLNDTHKKFIASFSTIMWVMGGSVMLLEMMSIVLAQN